MGCLRAPLTALGVRRETPAGVRRPKSPLSIQPELIAALKQRNPRSADEIDRWANGAPAIIAGQQVGFAGGPLYTLAKILTILKMKRELGGTAFFWLATEDHDWDEVATLYLPGKGSIRARRPAGTHAMVGPQPVPESLITELLAYCDMPRPHWLREGIAFGESFAELIASVFGGEIVLVDALLPELRRAGAPLFEQIRAREHEIQAAIRKGQVVAREGEDYTLLYAIDDEGNRERTTASAPPERTSTSALTRPLLQDFVFGTDVFVGGPSEVAYYEQIAPVYALLGIAMPRVALRGHALVAPKRIAKAFQRYDLDPAEIFRDPDEILAEREPDGVTRIQELASKARRDLLARIGQIGELALPADHALARAFNRSVGHIEYHFDKLTERAIRGLVRKDRERLAAVRELVATLYPDRKVQDRIVGWFPFWQQHGPHLIERMLECVEPDAETFSIVSV